MARRLFVVTPFGRRLGGSDNILLSFLRQVDRGELDPTVVFLEPGPFEREVASLGLDTLALPGGRLRDPAHLSRTVGRLVRLLRRQRPALILNWLSTAHLYGGPAAAIARMSDRCIWWQLDLHRAHPFTRGQILDQIATLIPASAIGCCSGAVARAQAQVRPHRRTFSVLPGIARPPTIQTERLDGLRSKLELPEGVPIVGTVGRLFAWKGHHRMLEAVAKLRDSGSPAHVLIVGGGGHRGDHAYEAELRELVGKRGLTGSVTFTGQVDDATAYLRLMDVFVNASTPEPFGLVLVEAMAAGLPVVAVNAGGPREIVEPGGTGVLVPSGDPGDLAAGIEPLLADDAERRRLGAAGRERYERCFTEERMAAEMSRRLLEL